MAEYSDTVAQLLKLGDPWEDIPFSYDYLKLGFTAEHIPQLIQMATNPAPYRSEKARHMWSVVHAWRVLAQLKAIEAVEPLLGMLELLPDVDYANDLEEVFSAIGVEALPLLEKYIQQPHEDEFKALTAVDLVTALGETYPEARAEAIRIITGKLSRFTENTLEINGLVIGNLLDLEAIEAIDTIRAAFQAKRVDPSLVGNLGDVEVFLGISEKPKRYDFDLNASEFIPEQMKILGQLLERMESGEDFDDEEDDDYAAPRMKSNAEATDEEDDLFGGYLDRATKHPGSKKKSLDAKAKKDKRKQTKTSQKKNRKRK
jgi:hypothetical protein